jgi:hypothetical protein
MKNIHLEFFYTFSVYRKSKIFGYLDFSQYTENPRLILGMQCLLATVGGWEATSRITLHLRGLKVDARFGFSSIHA